MLLISSVISTVLPTPAPAKSPALPPLEIGAIRSMALIPVSRISVLPDCSVKLGGWRWIGSIVAFFGAGFWSIGRPMTSNIRPCVSAPTGTEIGAPVELTLSPRLIPSVLASAIERILVSLRCWATSSTNLSLPGLISNAS